MVQGKREKYIDLRERKIVTSEEKLRHKGRKYTLYEKKYIEERTKHGENCPYKQ